MKDLKTNFEAGPVDSNPTFSVKKLDADVLKLAYASSPLNECHTLECMLQCIPILSKSMRRCQWRKQEDQAKIARDTAGGGG